MACVALASLISTIKLEFLQPFPRVPLHDQEPIRSFLGRISSLQAFLKESKYGAAAAAAIKDLEIQIRDFALEAEDNIEIQLSNVEKASRELHQTLQEATEKAAELLNIIDSIRNEDDDEENEIQPSIHWLKHASESENDNSDGSSQFSPELVGRMVGRHSDRIEIINQLFQHSSEHISGYSYKINLILIVGMVGIGKTTLAKSVYGDLQVEYHFDVRGWVTMPQEYSKSEMVRLILRSISPAAENQIGKLAEQVTEVRRLLRDKRFLIVLDNIHDSRACMISKHVFMAVVMGVAYC